MSLGRFGSAIAGSPLPVLFFVAIVAVPEEVIFRHQQVGTEDVLDAAQLLFVRHGLDGTSLAQIARNSGVEAAALETKFSSKSEILWALIDRLENQFVHRMIERVAIAGPSAKDKIIAFLDERLLINRGYANDVLLLTQISLEFRKSPDDVGERITRLNGHIQRTIEGVVEQGKMRGQFRTDLGTPELASSIVAAHDGALLTWSRGDPEMDGKRFIRALQSTLVRGLEEQLKIVRDRPSGIAPGQHP